MRVIHLIKGQDRGGAEGLLPQLVRNCGPGFAYGVDYFLPWKDALVEEIDAAGAPVRYFGARSNAGLLASVPEVARWLRRERADFVHAHLPLAGVVGRLARRLANMPVVYTEHNFEERYLPWTRRATRLTWRLQERVVAVSEEVADSIRRHLGDRVPDLLASGADPRILTLKTKRSKTELALVCITRSHGV